MAVSAVFSDDGNAEAAMQGYYNTMMNNPRAVLNGGIGLDAALSADELVCTATFAAEDSFQVYHLSASNMENTESFDTFYNLLFLLNSMLDGLRMSSGVSSPMKAQLEGEALFNRAFLYFYLVNLYGAVPLALTTDYSMNSALPRTSVDSIYAQVIDDLGEAIPLLPVNYPEGTGYPGNRTRPDQSAAQALLARVWLYRGQWTAAETAATRVIDDPRYVLDPDLDSVFVSSSGEAIWQLQPLYENWATADGNAYLRKFPAGRASFVLTPELLGSMEPGDQRRVHWIDSSLYQGQVFRYPYKYKLTVNTGPTMEYEMVLRLAEQYLIRAEARAQQGELSGAIADVNVIRARAGLPATMAVTQTEVLEAIFQERRIELFGEWGHRWLDLKRTGQADLVLHAKTGWEQYDTLYPIPNAELLADPRVLQNPGY
jgi:hypothetical protein